MNSTGGQGRQPEYGGNPDQRGRGADSPDMVALPEMFHHLGTDIEERRASAEPMPGITARLDFDYLESVRSKTPVAQHKVL